VVRLEHHLEVLRVARDRHPALDAGADDYLEKAGLTSALLDRSIRYAVAQSRASAELERKVQERTEELARANAALR
jgi:C4-dicarboxylate-specific signal transduction histidine kinase